MSTTYSDHQSRLRLRHCQTLLSIDYYYYYTSACNNTSFGIFVERFKIHSEKTTTVRKSNFTTWQLNETEFRWTERKSWIFLWTTPITDRGVSLISPVRLSAGILWMVIFVGGLTSSSTTKLYCLVNASVVRQRDFGFTCWQPCWTTTGIALLLIRFLAWVDCSLSTSSRRIRRSFWIEYIASWTRIPTEQEINIKMTMIIIILILR